MTRSRPKPQPLYRSAKLWMGVALVAILAGALWWNRKEASGETETSETAAGVPVPLSDAPAEDAAPRRTAVPDSRLIDVSDDPRKGGSTAPVRIVEFADFQCPSCGHFFANTYGALNKLYGERLEWVFLDLPLTQSHNRAMPAAIAAACAHRQGKFWPYHDQLFGHQNRLMDRDLKKYAEEVGLDVETWEGCYESQEPLPQIQQDVALADELGVSGTPTFFLGDKTLKGAMPVTAFMEVIDPLLKSPPPPASGP
jgi:protein-disulfide isomerase